MSSRALTDLQPIAMVAAQAAIAECESAGLHVLVTCTYRPPYEQTALYAQGRTAPGKIVTNAQAGQSFHQWRVALDIVPMVNGKPDWDGADPIWGRIAVIFKRHGFEWGGDWVHFRELPHFQMTGGHPITFFQQGGKLQ